MTRGAKLEAIERCVLIVAGVLAIFPLLQYLSETEERRLARDATLVVSYMGCLGSGGLRPGLTSDTPEGIRDICDRIAVSLSGQ